MARSANNVEVFRIEDLPGRQRGISTLMGHLTKLLDRVRSEGNGRWCAIRDYKNQRDATNANAFRSYLKKIDKAGEFEFAVRKQGDSQTWVVYARYVSKSAPPPTAPTKPPEEQPLPF